MLDRSVLLGDEVVPNHIAIIMDGNRRWAHKRGLPSAVGHVNGAMRVRSIIQACADRGVKYVTLFAFSTENWQRPPAEVSALMGLLRLYLQKEVKDMNAKGIRFKVIGDVSRFDKRTQALIRDAEKNTSHNDVITLTVAVNYGGRWDMLQAVKSWQSAHPDRSLDTLTEAELEPYFCAAHAPAPDLLIRTGGEARVSNFMLWQLAYSELYFSDVLWPAFSEADLDRAIASFSRRDRRFGGNSPSLAANA
jgi:undecaprenyl diphosphate synthase